MGVVIGSARIDERGKARGGSAGDTLWGISSKLLGAGARWTEIAELNGLTSTVINIGRGLKIPQEVRRDKP